jgi:cellulose biosynthesis protein BcsQ
VGKTSLVYHLAWMYAEFGVRVLAADLDPQANLTAAFLDEDEHENFWPDGDHPKTLFGCVQPLLRGVGDIAAPYVHQIDHNLALLVGDLALSVFEDELASQWSDCLERKERAFRATSAFWRIVQKAAAVHEADLVLVDLGPNLGAINRAALIASDNVGVPLAPDWFSLQGLRQLGPRLRLWREEWNERLKKSPSGTLDLPPGRMQPIGYVVVQRAVRLDRPVHAYQRWMRQIPGVYRRSVLDLPGETSSGVQQDPDCLALVKHYHTLMPMAQEARKPVFMLKAADGAIGAHLQAVQEAWKDFKSLAHKISTRTGVELESLTIGSS